MLLFFCQMFLTCACACICVVHWHCTAQLSMFNMEKRFRNKIIIIIIITPTTLTNFTAVWVGGVNTSGVVRVVTPEHTPHVVDDTVQVVKNWRVTWLVVGHERCHV